MNERALLRLTVDDGTWTELLSVVICFCLAQVWPYSAMRLDAQSWLCSLFRCTIGYSLRYAILVLSLYFVHVRYVKMY
jgi:hypothetical protein